MLAFCGFVLIATLHVHGGVQPAPASAAAGTTTAVPAARPAAAPECRAADLRADYRARDAAAGHRYGVVRLRNTSDRSCVVQGYGGLSYVGAGRSQIGAAADRDPGTAPRVVLEPGERATSLVTETVAADYPRSRCRPAHVDAFRVYPPDATRSQVVAHPTSGCRNPEVHLLSHRAFR